MEFRPRHGAPIQHFLSFLFPYGKPPISRQFGMLYQGEVYQVLRDQIVFPDEGLAYTPFWPAPHLVWGQLILSSWAIRDGNSAA